MIIDCHVHMMNGGSKEGFIKSLDTAGICKAMVLAPPPSSFKYGDSDAPRPAADRLKAVMDYANFSDRFLPMFWIDPLEEDALEQADKAVEAGVKGFKVICNRYFPGDERPMKVWEHIAGLGKPILFHSGILYSTPHASTYNRPVNFEPLFDIPKLKFAMAHVSWPWHDECLAVYGYWSSRNHRGNTTTELFIDTTPGTPRIYREEVMTKLYTIGYNVEDNVMYGSDCHVDYDSDYARDIIDRDKKYLDKCNISQEAQEKYFSGNTMRFLGIK
jgi:predicted TIM-barrel fold metal-dependent hydrolase